MLFELFPGEGILETFAPGTGDGPEAFPDHPLFAGSFEEEFFVNQAPVDNVRDHLPIAGYLAEIAIFLAARRTNLHHILGSLRVKIGDEPRAGLAQDRL